MAKPTADPVCEAQDSEISVARAATLLECSAPMVRRYLKAGLLRGCRLLKGTRYRVSKLSVLELRAKLLRQMHQLEPLP